MNYNHTYHAGGFSDVFKHLILLAITQSFLRKENPFCYIDTHAGAGFYDLSSEEAKKNKEFEGGLGKILQQKNIPDLAKLYLNCIHRMNNKLAKSTISSLRYYPGSPAFVRYFLRNQDRMLLSELHPTQFQLLKNYFSDRLVSVHLMDGYHGLKALLPPKERRGFILIDPPFERQNEFSHLLTHLPFALKRFATGTYAIWYPIKDLAFIERFHQALRAVIVKPILLCELNLNPTGSTLFLNGCGMIIINPPWQVDQHIKAFLPWLTKTLHPTQGQYRVKLL